MNPMTGIVVYLLAVIALYSEVAEKSKNEPENDSEFLDYQEKPSEVIYKSKSHESREKDVTYVANPRYGKTKMLWGMILIFFGALLFLINPVISMIIILIGSGALILGRFENWWHWH